MLLVLGYYGTGSYSDMMWMKWDLSCWPLLGWGFIKVCSCRYAIGAGVLKFWKFCYGMGRGTNLSNLLGRGPKRGGPVQITVFYGPVWVSSELFFAILAVTSGP